MVKSAVCYYCGLVKENGLAHGNVKELYRFVYSGSVISKCCSLDQWTGSDTNYAFIILECYYDLFSVRLKSTVCTVFLHYYNVQYLNAHDDKKNLTPLSGKDGVSFELFSGVVYLELVYYNLFNFLLILNLNIFRFSWVS